MSTAGVLPKDQNFIAAVGGVSSLTDSSSSIRPFQYDPVTRGMLVHLVGKDNLSATGINGGPVTVGVTAVELTFTGSTKTISIKSASTNTGLIWFGPATVDNTGANAYGELTADSAVEIEINDSSAAIYVVSNVAAQKVYKAALT